MLIGIRFSRVLLFALLLSLVRLPASHAQNDEPFTLFRDYIGLNEDQIKAIRKSSDPPQLSDLEGFTLESDDITQLKNCEPGRCEVQLPTKAMDVFRQSINWSAPDTANQVNQLGQKTARVNNFATHDSGIY